MKLIVINYEYGGIHVKKEDDEGIRVGSIILSLIARGIDIYHEGQSHKEGMLLRRHEEGVQGGMENWDSDVFELYYGIDLNKALEEYAALFGYQVVYE